jgi:hypothetical protein
MVPRATTTTPDPELSMPLQPAQDTEPPPENPGELVHAGDVSAERPHAGEHATQTGRPGQPVREGAKP